MTKAHLRTGRDSIKARQKRNDLEAKQSLTVEQVDADFLRRLEDLLIKDQTYFDIDLLRTEFSKWDQHRIGKMAKEGAYLICSERTPLYGSLLKNLINRCEEDKDNKISWPLLLNFLEKAQAKAWEKHPELASVPDKVKVAASVRIATPDPIDELSSSTRSRVMTKLLRKASQRRNSAADSSLDGSDDTRHKDRHSKPEDRQNKTANKDGSQEKVVKQEDKNETVAPEKTGQKSEVKTASEKVEPLAVQKKGEPLAVQKKGEPLAVQLPRHESQPNNRIPLSDVMAVAPRDFKTSQLAGDPPKERLQLDWVYGYRGQDCACNLDLLASGEIIYFIASTVIIYSHVDHWQRHYREHTEDIRSLCVHHAGLLVASGQFASRDERGHKAHVRVWRSDTLQTLHLLGADLLSKCVLALCFMPGEDILACADNSPDKKLTVWDVKDGSLVAETFISTEMLSDMTFNPKYPELLVTCGREHLAWWKVYVQSKRIVSSAQPNYESFLKARFVNCLRHNLKGDLITGDSNGTVYIWGNGGNSITNFVKHGHDGPVLGVLHYKNHLMTSGRDGALHCWTWNRNMDKDGTLQLPKSEGGIRALLLLPVEDSTTSTLVLGTTFNSLLYLNVNLTGSPLEGVVLDDVPITHGHTGDLKAIRGIPKSFLGADVITASTDGVICKLSSSKKQPVWKLWMKGYPFLCVDTTAEGDQMILGTKDGHLVILQVMRDDMTVVELLNKKISTGAITTIKLSPDGRKIATGGTDKTIHIYCLQAVEGTDDEVWALSGKCKGHHGNIHGVDWSSNTLDGHVIVRSSSTIPEQKFWNVSTFQELGGEVMSDVMWASTNCLLDHTLIGLWKSKQASEGHMTCVDVSPDLHLATMATSSGSLNLFRYPSCTEGDFSHTYRSHAHTHNLTFTPDGKNILTVGGADVSIMQWKLV
ncbi:echinoderm microtubule-associated protein-like 2 isoform X1 [Physella acuta]|nr:echinoderm microtubule-associated protein-like 2 isoform X1 [Physella acuta]